MTAPHSRILIESLLATSQDTLAGTDKYSLFYIKND